MSIRIRPNKIARRVHIEVSKRLGQHQQGIENALHVTGAIVGRRVKQLIKEGPKTGRIYRFRGQPHQASAPGEAPANRSGSLMKSYNYNVHGPRQMELGENSPYAGFLEDGTRRMKPRPHVIRAITETQGDTIRAFYDETAKVMK